MHGLACTTELLLQSSVMTGIVRTISYVYTILLN